MSQHNSLVVVCPAFSARHQLQTKVGLPFAEHFPEDAVHGFLRRTGHCFRERVFTPAVTLWTFLNQVLDPDHSCRQAVARLLAHRTAQGLRPCSPDTGAYCKARGRLPEELIRELTRATGRRLLEQTPSAWLWQGRPVKVVDGTGLSMPDTPKNRVYPKSKKLPPGIGFPMVRLVVIFSLAVGTVLEAALGPFQGKRTGELSLFRQVADQLQRGDILLADRLYATYWNVALAVVSGVDVVLRQNASRAAISFRGYCAANRRTWWHKPARPEWMSLRDYQRLPNWLRLRAVRVLVTRAGFRTRRLVLITTLTDAQAITAADLADLYRRRWQAELFLRSLKQTLQMDILRGRSPEIVRKEIWAHLLVYNIVRTIMAQAARQEHIRPDEISFAGAL
jgi:Transposase DDE domain/Insertion element 4 transposase N-terminal